MKAIIITFKGEIKDEHALVTSLASNIANNTDAKNVDVSILSDEDVMSAMVAKCLTPTDIAVDRPSNPQIPVIEDFCKKIVASIAKKFVCIVDDSKWVEQLGREFPLPVEVIPMARSAVARKIVSLGGDPVYREGVVTDNGNVILDVYNLNILNALELEKTINNIPGVVCNGIFALNKADIAVVATDNGIEERTAI